MYNKILLPVDGREGGWRAIKAATKAIEICSGEFVLLHVEEAISDLIGGADRREIHKEQEKISLAKLGPVIDFLKQHNKPYKVVFADGDIADSIIKVSFEEHVDAIAMFTDGVQSLSELFTGSLTQRVLCDIECDLLSVRK